MSGGMKRGEKILRLPTTGVPHLCKDNYLCVFKSRGDAEKAAVRTGGQSYQSKLTGAFLVKYDR